jgi:ADP-ribose pyrophosphatase
MSDKFSEIRISGERVFEGRIVRLEIDRVRLAGGVESSREVVRHRGAAVILPILDDGRLLFVRQFRYPVDSILLELPAGTLEAGEPPRDCAERELVEETGHAAGELLDLGSFFSAPGFTDEILHAFAAVKLTPASGPGPDPDEVVEVEALTVAEAFERVANGEIRDAKTLASLLLARLQGVIEP